MNKAKKISIGFFLFAVIILYVIIYAIPSVTGALTKTTVLEYGTLQITDDAVCYVVRDEKVYSAANKGSINYYIEDRTLLRRGTQVLDVVSAGVEGEESKYQDIITRLGDKAVTSQNYKAEFKGVVSYYIDGYEGLLTPENMRDLEYEDVKDIKNEPVNLVRADTLAKEPLYKICNNNKWYLLCFASAADISKYEVGKKVTVNLPLSQVSAVVTDIIEKKDKWLVIMQSNKYYEDFGKIRRQEATVVTSDYSGILIENDSIATKGGTVGVYVKRKNGEYLFTPVKVIASDGEKSLAQRSSYIDKDGNQVDSVEVYDEILRKPPGKPE